VGSKAATKRQPTLFATLYWNGITMNNGMSFRPPFIRTCQAVCFDICSSQVTLLGASCGKMSRTWKVISRGSLIRNRLSCGHAKVFEISARAVKPRHNYEHSSPRGKHLQVEKVTPIRYPWSCHVSGARLMQEVPIFLFTCIIRINIFNVIVSSIHIACRIYR
jgi:hypothetical protein